MNKNQIYRKILFLTMTALVISFLIPAVSSIPTIEIDPESPKPEGTVTITATMTDISDIQEVVVFVEECQGDSCFRDTFNETMTLTDTDTYQTQITLQQGSATEMKYRIGYKTSTDWIWYPENLDDLIVVDLDTSTNGGENGNSEPADGDDEQSTPGFEILTLLISIIILILILRRKRKA